MKEEEKRPKTAANGGLGENILKKREGELINKYKVEVKDGNKGT